MIAKLAEEPRKFIVGIDNSISISDYGTITLEPNEQITLLDRDGAEYDVAAKDWGYYATPSINHRLKNQNYKTALVKNSENRVYVMLVKNNKIDLFNDYCKKENQTIITWIDDDYAL